MNVTDRVVSGAKLMLVGQAVRMASKGIIVFLLTSIFLQPGEYGLLSFAISILGVGVLLASLGIPKSAARFIADYKETSPDQIRHIISTTLRYNLVTVAIVCVVLVVLNGPIARLLNEPRLAPFLLLGAGYVAFVSLRKFAKLMFQGFGRVNYSAAIAVVGNVTVLVTVVGLLLLGASALNALLGYIVGYGIAAAVAFGILYVKFYSKYDASRKPETGLSTRILRYAVPLTATRGANVLDRKIDTILVGFLIGPVAVGYYTLSKQLSGFVIAPANSIGYAAAPAYGEYKATDNLERAASLYEKTFKYTLAVYLPAAAGIFLVAEPVITVVFGADYLGAAPVLELFSLYVLLRAIDKITNDSLDYLGRARTRAYIKGGASVSNFVLNLFAIPAFGVVGAAGATVLTQTALIGAQLILVYRDLPVDPSALGRATLLTSGVTVGMGAAVVLLVPLAENILSLSAVILVGVGTWTVFSTVLGVFSIDEVRAVLT